MKRVLGLLLLVPLLTLGCEPTGPIVWRTPTAGAALTWMPLDLVFDFTAQNALTGTLVVTLNGNDITSAFTLDAPVNGRITAHASDVWGPGFVAPGVERAAGRHRLSERHLRQTDHVRDFGRSLRRSRGGLRPRRRRRVRPDGASRRCDRAAARGRCLRGRARRRLPRRLRPHRPGLHEQRDRERTGGGLHGLRERLPHHRRLLDHGRALRRAGAGEREPGRCQLVRLPLRLRLPAVLSGLRRRLPRALQRQQRAHGACLGGHHDADRGAGGRERHRLRDARPARAATPSISPRWAFPGRATCASRPRLRLRDRKGPTTLASISMRWRP